MARVAGINSPPVQNRNIARIRVYCDNDARFKPKWQFGERPDDQDPNRLRFDPTSPFYDLDLQEWVDKKNDLSHIGRTCATDPTILARTYRTTYDDGHHNDLQYRVTITVSDRGA